MELVKRLFIGCLGFLFIYLMCSFYHVTFNISKWSEGTRFIAILWGNLLFGFFAICAGYNFKNKC
jgi:hypothetical protein